jgi:hypothetical protein
MTGTAKPICPLSWRWGSLFVSYLLSGTFVPVLALHEDEHGAERRLLPAFC